MSKVCDICGKRPVVGNTISHAHNVSKRRFLPNIQNVNAVVDGKKQKIKVCTKCIKAGKVQKSVRKSGTAS
ncbi:MAG: 50S ribosomal protein L28 [Fibrobacterota bacterium]